MTGQACPECGGQRPGCACARAELAAAEDFDPLRIRPYVTLDAQEEPGDGADGRGGPDGPGGAVPGGAGGAVPGGPDGAGDGGDPPTTQLRAVRAGAAGHGQGQGQGQGHEGAPYGASSYDSSPGPSSPYGSEGGAHETMPLLLGGAGGGVRDSGPAPAGARDGRKGRRRGGVVVGVAAVAVVGTAALAAAVLSGGETADRSLAPEVVTSASLNLAVPEETTSSGAPSPSRTPSRTPSPSSSSPTATPTTASASPSPSSSASASASASAPVSASAAPTVTGSPSATGGAAASESPAGTPETSSAPTTASPTPAHTDAPEGAALSVGDTGPEVRELQLRLRILWVYLEEADGVFDESLRGALIQYQSRFWRLKDTEGVYGPHTRRELERDTEDYYDHG
ncbi:peptidoglycan-binding protein [Streptomyces sp. NPDC127049]|uniref:peptidoglycan-binding domain-containing protein n=1 Tax=Streptomyces sp. NPDC127049 TaxID=3347118 RepID=UPI003653960E